MDMAMNNSMGTALHWVNLNAVAPAITVQPTGGEYDGVTPITLTVTATGTAPLTYQWQSSPAGAGTWSNIEGATASTYEAAPEEDTDYRVVVSNAAGSANSDAAAVTVVSATFADIWSGADQIFDLSPDSVTLATTKAATIASVGGDTDSKWQQGTDANRPTYTAEDADFNGLPSLESAGSPVEMNHRNTADSADKLQSAWMGGTEGYVVALVKPADNANTNTDAKDLPALLSGTGVADSGFGIAYRGGSTPEQITGHARKAASAFNIYNRAGTLANGTAALVAIVVKDGAFTLWVNGVAVATGAVETIYVAEPMRMFRGGNAYGLGKLGPHAGHPTVPADFEDRMAATMTLAGIS